MDAALDSHGARVHHVERVHGLVGDVKLAAVGSADDAMGNLDVGDPADDLVGLGIDHVGIIAGGIGLDDAHREFRRFAPLGGAGYPVGHDAPFRVVLTPEMRAAAMKGIAPGVPRQNMRQQPAQQRIFAGTHHGQRRFVVHPRLFLGPEKLAFLKRLQAEIARPVVALNAAHIAFPFRQEDGLHLVHEIVEIGNDFAGLGKTDSAGQHGRTECENSGQHGYPPGFAPNRYQLSRTTGNATPSGGSREPNTLIRSD